MSTIQQFNIGYDPLEDRILLKILLQDNREVRVWFTRRYTRLLLDALDHSVDAETDPVAVPHQEELKAFRREATLSAVNTSEAYKGNPQTTPLLGESPLLVSRVDIQKGEGGTVVLTLGQEQKGGKNINVRLERSMVDALVKLLLSAASTAQWGLGAVSAGYAASAAVVH